MIACKLQDQYLLKFRALNVMGVTKSFVLSFEPF